METRFATGIQDGWIKPRELAFDIDGVFADTFRTFVMIAREEYGLRFDYEDITEYDFQKVIRIEEKIAEEIIRRILDSPLETGIKPVSGAVDVLRRLSRLQPILFVTARSDEGPILEWIGRHLQPEDMSVIQLEATGTRSEKIPTLLKRGVRYFVEDCLETCYLLNEAAVTPIIFDQPWNRKPHPFQTVKTWDEISVMIDWSADRLAG